jgi:hypothetical protein
VATLDRRVVPAIATVVRVGRTLDPVSELERYPSEQNPAAAHQAQTS